MTALVPSGHVVGLLSWLTPSLPEPLVRVFEFALRGKRGKATEDDFAELSQLGDDCIRAALRAASGTGRLDSVLPGFTGWLCTRRLSGADDRRYWQQALAGLSLSDAAQRAYLDTALLSVGAPPVALPPPVGHRDHPDYANQLVGVWKQLAAASDRFSRENCVLALARYLDGQPWTATRQQALAVVELCDRIGRHDRGNVLVGTLASGLDATPAAKGWDFAQQLLEWVRKNDPDAVRNGTLVTLEGLPSGTSPYKIAELCLRAAARNIKPEAAFSSLARSGAMDSAVVVANLLVDLHTEFDRAGVDPKLTADWQRRLVGAIAQGEFSRPRADFAREVRDLVSRYTRDEMWSHFEVLSTLTKSVRDGQYDLADDERDNLAALGEAIDGFLRKSAKRPSLLRSVLPGGRGDYMDRKELWVDVDKEGRQNR
jgi:hypothetical protein